MLTKAKIHNHLTRMAASFFEKGPARSYLFFPIILYTSPHAVNPKKCRQFP
jgi:hypothetical protein